jgi:PAS domain S-box-containing protein
MDETSAKASILLVDDKEEDLLALVYLLKAEDYDCVTVTSGPQALREVLRRDFAVIVIDVHMPVMDGFEVASIIKQRDRSRHTPIVFLTAASPDVSYIYKAYSVGAVDYLEKPVDRDVFRAKVAIFVDLFQKGWRIKQQAEALVAADRRERERKLAELKHTSERRYRNLAESIPQILWTAGTDGSVDYFNQRWLDYTGIAANQATGWAWLDAVHPDDAELYRGHWARASAAGEGFQLELRLRDKSGVYRWHLCRAVPDRGKDEQIVGWLGTHTD